MKELFLEDILELTQFRIGLDQSSNDFGGGRRRTQEKKKDAITQVLEVMKVTQNKSTLVTHMPPG